MPQYILDKHQDAMAVALMSVVGMLVLLPFGGLGAVLWWAAISSSIGIPNLGEVELALVAATGAAIYAAMLWLLLRWLFYGVRAGLMPQYVQIVWFRRFNSERSSSARLSQVIDGLPLWGIAPVTLQDRNVRFSARQRLNRQSLLFWTLGGATLVGFLLLFRSYPFNFTAQTPWTIYLMVYAGFGYVAAPVLAAVSAIMAIAYDSAPRVGDDYLWLDRILDRRAKGVRTIKVDDKNWRATVRKLLSRVDMAVIDVSDLTEAIEWEIAQSVSSLGLGHIVFIAQEIEAETVAQRIAEVTGIKPHHVILYDSRTTQLGNLDEQLRATVFGVFASSGLQCAR